ncbi:MAG: hypothetical protein M0C28_38075 [Candidatus Moduliflexus flocculans]|nr:hypothetical protein [Candidatus Moduliflexus flocculans]
MEARAAGLPGRLRLRRRVRIASRSNPETDAIIEAIRTWEEAKDRGVFSDEQRTRLKDPERDFHLERTGEGGWVLQIYDKVRFEHAEKILQPGEPAGFGMELRERRPGPSRSHLHLLLTGDGAEVEGPRRSRSTGSSRSTVPAALKKGQSLVWDGSGTMILYDEKGRKTGTVEVGKSLPLLQTGKHTLSIEAEFTAGDRPVIKGTVKLAGAVETVGR